MSRVFEANAIVVGAGAGGAAVAGELLRAGKRVIMLEAGPSRQPQALDHARNDDPSDAGLERFGDKLAQALVYPSNAPTASDVLVDFKTVHETGGMMGYWTCNCPTPHAAELAPGIGETQWLSLLNRARQLLHVGLSLGRDGVRQARLVEAARSAVGPLESGREVQPMPVAARRVDGAVRFSSVGELLAAQGSQPGDFIRSEFICTRVLTEGGRAIGVEGRKNGGHESEARFYADAVVLAAGVAGTPKILAASDLSVGPALGRYLFDHPTIASRVVLKDSILDGVPADDPVFTVWIPYSPTHPWHNQICRFPSNPTAIEYASPHEFTADIFTFASMQVVPDNRFEFDFSRRDPFGLPAIVGDYRLSEKDYKTLSRGLAEHLQIAAAVGDLVKHRWSPFFFGPGWSTHLMGSCRMGTADDGTSCVDVSGRLWRYENIYVAGNAILPTSNAGNPTLTTVALGLATANAILGRAKDRRA
jgi:choline dehydrogenase-like flavoprotein